MKSIGNPKETDPNQNGKTKRNKVRAKTIKKFNYHKKEICLHFTPLQRRKINEISQLKPIKVCANSEESCRCQSLNGSRSI